MYRQKTTRRVVVVVVVVLLLLLLLLLLLGNYRIFDGAFFFTSRAFYSGFVLISAFLRGAAGLELTCCRCLKMCSLWWLRADFTIFAGVWFCCFSTSTDVGFCLTRFSIRMFALPQDVRSWWDWPCMFLGHLI